MNNLLLMSYSEQTNVTTADYNGSSVSEQASHSMNVVSMVLFTITCVLGIPGNAFVVWIAGVKMKKTVTTTWYVNLAVADLLCCLAIPLIMAEIGSDYWPYGSAMCKILPSVICLNMFASVFTLTLISLDRLTLVFWPVWAQNHRNIFGARLLCGLTWFLALLLTLPSLIYRETMERDNKTFCIYTNLSVHIMRLVCCSVFGFLIPLLVITVCYLLIARKLSLGRYKTQKALRVMVAVVTAFFVCWMPYHTLRVVMIMYRARTRSSVDMALALPLARSLACINSFLNPVLYTFMGQEFKEKVRISLRRTFENAFSEDATPSSVSSKRLMSQVIKSSEAQL